jgi:nucleotide-binding universal stress UspA family protein
MPSSHLHSERPLASQGDAPTRFLRVPWFPHGRCVVAAVTPDFHDDVLRLAFAHAQTTGARLIVCAVVETEEDCAGAHERLELRRRRMFPLDARIDLECRIGEPVEQILECIAAHDTSLVVVGEGTHRKGLLGRLFWPNVPTRVMRGTTVPIMVTRKSPGTGRILAATTLGEGTAPVMNAVADELARAGGTVTVLHCLEPMAVLASAETPTMLVAPTDEMEAVAEEHMRKAAREAGIEGARFLVEVASPADRILELARTETTDLIVVATHGRTGAARLLLGSVAEEVVRDAPCNVLVVHLGDRDDEEEDDDEGSYEPVLASY